MLVRVVGVLVFILLLLGEAVAEQPQQGRYHALVIGNNNYQHLADLKTAQNDAVAVANLLGERYGFETELLLNATRVDIITALAALRATLIEKDNLLIYYAGHGFLDEDSGEGYWLPVDAERDNPAHWVSNNDITSQLKAMVARHVMVVADSCYSGTLTRGVEVALRTAAERQEWLKRAATRRSRTALTSGGLEPVQDAGGGEHSVFARAFLEALDENREALDGRTLFDRVKGPVVANADQTPEYQIVRKSGDQRGDFIFLPKGTASPAEATSEASTASASISQMIEIAFWETIKDSDSPDDLRDYLSRFPDGNFAGIAKRRLEALPGAPAASDQQTAVLVAPKPALEIDEVEVQYVALKNANVRQGPSAKTAKMAFLLRGTEITVTGRVRGADWLRVEPEGGGAGFVYAPLLGEKAAVVAGSGEVAPRKAAPTVEEVAFWSSVKDSNDPATLEAYLTRFPDGVFAELVEASLLALTAPAAGAPATALLMPSEDHGLTPIAALKEEGAPSEQRTAFLAPPAAGIADAQARPTAEVSGVYNVLPIKDRRGMELFFLTEIVRNALSAMPGAKVVTLPANAPGYETLVAARITRMSGRRKVNPKYQAAQIAGQIFGAFVGFQPPMGQISPIVVVYEVEIVLEARNRTTGAVVSETGAATLKLDATVMESDAAGNAMQIAVAEAVDRLVIRLSGKVPPPRVLPDADDGTTNFGSDERWADDR